MHKANPHRTPRRLTNSECYISMLFSITDHKWTEISKGIENLNIIKEIGFALVEQFAQQHHFFSSVSGTFIDHLVLMRQVPPFPFTK